MTQDILVILGSQSDLPITKSGFKILNEMEVGYSCRIASAHRTPELVHEIVSNFEKQGGKTILCVAGKSAHLAGVVASQTLLPVLAIPVYNPETAGFDALLSMGQMPKGIPVATMGLGSHGFTNACLQAMATLALFQEKTAKKLSNYRKQLVKDTIQADREHSFMNR
jgi:phosphoribosylaminoimidazole carboxylase PurE protein